MEHRGINTRAMTLLNVLNAVQSELLDICLDTTINIHDRINILEELLPKLNLRFSEVEDAYQDYMDGDLSLEGLESYLQGYIS